MQIKGRQNQSPHGTFVIGITERDAPGVRERIEGDSRSLTFLQICYISIPSLTWNILVRLA
jgi:hypothetical protein